MRYAITGPCALALAFVSASALAAVSFSALNPAETTPATAQASSAAAVAPGAAAPAASDESGDGRLKIPYLSGPVIDEVGLLDADARARIDAALRSFHRQGKLQMVVYLPSSLRGMDIADFSIRLGEAWKLGRKGQDQGLILVIAPNERKMRLEVGYGLEGTLTDAYSKHVLDDVLRPYFKEQRYGDGILAAIGDIATRLGVSAEVPQVAPPQTVADSGPSSLLATLLPLLLPFLLLMLFLRRIFRPRRRSFFGGGGFWGGGFGGGFGGGGGGFGGGDSFGGGGGGFGGGGASSSW